MKVTMTQFYEGGPQKTRPNEIRGDMRDWETQGWIVKSITMGMGGMWVVYEKDQK